MLRRAGGMRSGRGTKRNVVSCGVSAAGRWRRSLILLRPTVFLSEARVSSLGASCRCMHTGGKAGLVADTVEGGGEGEEEDDDDATLEDYEDLLLNSAATDAPGDETPAVGGGEPQSVGPSPLSSTAIHVNNITELLPADGTGIRLTTITPFLDVEAVSEIFGSVLSFVQLFPHRFRSYQVEESDGSLRWYVSLVQAKTKPVECVSVVKEKEEEKGGEWDSENKNDITMTQRQVRVKLNYVDDNLSEKNLRHILQQLRDTLPQNKPIPTAGLLHTFPSELQDSIRDSGGGVLRILKNTLAEEYVDLSQDASLVSVKGVLTSQGTTTYHQQYLSKGDGSHKMSLSAVSPGDYAEDTWDVELNLDDDDEDAALAAAASGTRENDCIDDTEPDDEFFRVGSSATAAVPTHSDTRHYQTQSIPPAPPKPPESLAKSRTPPPLPSKKKSASSSTSCMSAEELLQAHTAMAFSGGKRSPVEMLDLFVECIPTTYVPVQKIKVTDILAKVLGPRNTLHRVIKIYSYYFDRNKELDVVRLKPTLQHPRLGVANSFYDDGNTGASATSLTHRKLQESNVTRAFPVLHTPIRATINLSVAQKKEEKHVKPASDAIFTSDTSTQELFTLLEALPHECYINISEWARMTNVPISTLISFTQNASNHHFFLSRKSSEEQQGPDMWRLRPYWLAPGCSGELGPDDSCEAAAIDRYLKPIWLPIDRLLQKLSVEERNSVVTISSSSGGVGNWLRKFGRMCWVDKEGKKVRKYHASAELDDIVHVAVQYLQNSLPTEFVNLEEKISQTCHSSAKSNDGMTTHQNNGIRRLLAYGLAVAQQQESLSHCHELVDTVGRTKTQQENLYLFLSRHPQQLDLKKKDQRIWAAKHSLFRKYAGK